MWFTLVVILLVITPIIYKNWIWANWEVGAPYLATPPELIRRIMNLAQVSKKDVFCDLGSGDGRIVIAAAMHGAKAIGIEKDTLRAYYSKIWIKILGLKNVKIINREISKVNLSSVSVVCLFLTPHGNENLKDKLIKELKKGTRVVSVGFEFKGWKYLKKDLREDGYGPLYLYVM